MRTAALPVVLFCLAAVAATGSAWAQRNGGEERGQGQGQVRATGPLPMPHGNGNFVAPGPRMQANSTPMMRSRSDRAGKMACLQRVNLPPDTSVLVVQPIEFEGGTQCRIKIMRSNGLVQVISAQVER